MTHTPESRANKIWGLWREARLEGRTPPVRLLIALAIREAEDAALERAAAVASSYSSDYCEDDWETGRSQGAESIASDIRSLKHKKG